MKIGNLVYARRDGFLLQSSKQQVSKPVALKFCSRNADFDSILSRVSLMKSCKDFCHIKSLSLQDVLTASHDKENNIV